MSSAQSWYLETCSCPPAPVQGGSRHGVWLDLSRAFQSPEYLVPSDNCLSPLDGVSLDTHLWAAGMSSSVRLPERTFHNCCSSE